MQFELCKWNGKNRDILTALPSCVLIVENILSRYLIYTQPSDDDAVSTPAAGVMESKWLLRYSSRFDYSATTANHVFQKSFLHIIILSG